MGASQIIAAMAGEESSERDTRGQPPPNRAFSALAPGSAPCGGAPSRASASILRHDNGRVDERVLKLCSEDRRKNQSGVFRLPRHAFAVLPPRAPGTTHPDERITFAIERSCGASSSVKSVTASPERPARPLRPTLCTYCVGLCGKSKLTTVLTPTKSIPRAIKSVAMRTQISPRRNLSTMESRFAWVRSEWTTPMLAPFSPLRSLRGQGAREGAF